MAHDTSDVVPLTLVAQLAVSVVLAALLWVAAGRVAGWSAFLGGMTAVLPNAFLAARIMRSGASAPAMLRGAWLGEVGKLLLTVLLFGALFALIRPLAPLAVFGGYIAAQLVVFGALLLDGRADNRDATRKS